MIFSEQTKNLTTRDSEAGVSLMLAVLVLSAITAVAFSLAAIVFIEIRSSGDSSRTEPALYATFGVTEEALFQYKRFYSGSGLDVTSCNGGSLDLDTGSDLNNICYLNKVTLTLPGVQPIEFDDSPRVEFVGASATKTLPMFKADSYEQQFTDAQIEVLPNSTSSSIEAYFLQTSNDGTTLCAPGGDTEPCDLPEIIAPGEIYIFNSFDTTGQYQYELVLHNPSKKQDVSVSITTTRVGNTQPSGLPFVGEQVLRIMANYLGLTRTYQVRIPIP